ncbi:MAG: hypothetical protein Tsb0021_08390 [Chlamydiales bacterium]
MNIRLSGENQDFPYTEIQQKTGFSGRYDVLSARDKVTIQCIYQYKIFPIYKVKQGVDSNTFIRKNSVDLLNGLSQAPKKSYELHIHRAYNLRSWMTMKIRELFLFHFWKIAYVNYKTGDGQEECFEKILISRAGIEILPPLLRSRFKAIVDQNISLLRLVDQKIIQLKYSEDYGHKVVLDTEGSSLPVILKGNSIVSRVKYVWKKYFSLIYTEVKMGSDEFKEPLLIREQDKSHFENRDFVAIQNSSSFWASLRWRSRVNA